MAFFFLNNILVLTKHKCTCKVFNSAILHPLSIPSSQSVVSAIKGILSIRQRDESKKGEISGDGVLRSMLLAVLFYKDLLFITITQKMVSVSSLT